MLIENINQKRSIWRYAWNLSGARAWRVSATRNEDLSVTSERPRKLPTDTSECRCCAKMDQKYTRHEINSLNAQLSLKKGHKLMIWTYFLTFTKKNSQFVRIFL